MLTMALLSRYVTRLAPQRALRAFGVRFVAMSKLGDILTFRATVAEIVETAAGPAARLELSAANQSGAILVAGEATIALQD